MSSKLDNNLLTITICPAANFFSQPISNNLFNKPKPITYS